MLFIASGSQCQRCPGRHPWPCSVHRFLLGISSCLEADSVRFISPAWISHFQIAVCLQDPPLGSQESPKFHTPQAELPALPPLVLPPQWPPHHREWHLLSGPQAKSSTVPFDTCLCYIPINQDIFGLYQILFTVSTAVTQASLPLPPISHLGYFRSLLTILPALPLPSHDPFSTQQPEHTLNCQSDPNTVAQLNLAVAFPNYHRLKVMVPKMAYETYIISPL